MIEITPAWTDAAAIAALLAGKSILLSIEAPGFQINQITGRLQLTEQAHPVRALQPGKQYVITDLHLLNSRDWSWTLSSDDVSYSIIIDEATAHTLSAWLFDLPLPISDNASATLAWLDSWTGQVQLGQSSIIVNQPWLTATSTSMLLDAGNYQLQLQLELLINRATLSAVQLAIYADGAPLAKTTVAANSQIAAFQTMQHMLSLPSQTELQFQAWPANFIGDAILQTTVQLFKLQ